LETARVLRADGADPGPVLTSALELAAQGLSAAEAAGRTLLPKAAGRLWARALLDAPAAALPFALEALRVPDDRDPGDSVVWAPADHLAAAPRPHVWLLGLNARLWPRPNAEDPLLPAHILPIDADLSPRPGQRDRAAFWRIAESTSGSLCLSYASRTRAGAARTRSALAPLGAEPRRLSRSNAPRQALSEGDRLQARPLEAANHVLLGPAKACFESWRQELLTPWDGLLSAGHPVVLRALASVQSARSLTRLLRDPQRFVWEYALGWSAPALTEQPFGLDDRAFGDLTHQLLQRTVNRLEPDPGFTRATVDERSKALEAAIEEVAGEWPLQRPTPPAMLWRHTMDEAGRLTLAALAFDESFHPGTRSWTEVAFGQRPGRQQASRSPWDSCEPVPLPGAGVQVQGQIDRLELTAGDQAARVTDYKTGSVPARFGGLLLRGGAELQRVTYGAAVRHHRPDARIVARLVYLRGGEPREFKLSGDDLDEALAVVARAVLAGAEGLRRGVSLPGPDSELEYNPCRLALPSAREPFRQRKRAAMARALAPVSQVWDAR
jgi:hypothetical protein